MSDEDRRGRRRDPLSHNQSRESDNHTEEEGRLSRQNDMELAPKLIFFPNQHARLEDQEQ